ncbi:Pentatricopeptide repeat-containing protein 1, mitochondrial [Batrachochytrium dendrobatidis]|nr:Pentatricopeptide repeat-containing protein 1, mitochondrial [Batrachochytrium dendrobatidis]
MLVCKCHNLVSSILHKTNLMERTSIPSLVVFIYTRFRTYSNNNQQTYHTRMDTISTLLQNIKHDDNYKSTQVINSAKPGPDPSDRSKHLAHGIRSSNYSLSSNVYLQNQSNNLIQSLTNAISKHHHSAAYSIYTDLVKHTPDLLTNIPIRAYFDLIKITLTGDVQSLSGYTTTQRSQQALSVHEHMSLIVNPKQPDILFYAGLICIYAKNNDIPAIETTLAQVHRSKLDFNTADILPMLIRAYLLSGQPLRSLEYFKRYCIIDATAKPFNHLIKSYSLLNDEQGIQDTLDSMRKQEILKDSTTYHILAMHYYKKKDFQAIGKYINESEAHSSASKHRTGWDSMSKLKLRFAVTSQNWYKALQIIKKAEIFSTCIPKELEGDIITAYAFGIQNDVGLLLSTYCSSISTAGPLQSNIDSIVAHRLGSATNSKVLKSLYSAANGCKTPIVHVLTGIANGYIEQDDIVSANLIMNEISAREHQIPIVLQRKLAWKHLIICDTDGIFDWLDKFEQSQEIFDYSFWYNVMKWTLQTQSAETVDKVASRIQKYINEDTSSIVNSIRHRLVISGINPLPQTTTLNHDLDLINEK